VLAPKRILVVDDEIHIRQIVEMKLEAAGYDIASAANAEDALETARTFLPHLVVSDYRMPGELNGIEFISELRKILGLKEVPVILLTGSVAITQQLRSSMPDTTKVALISKPFSPRNLVKDIKLILGEDPVEV
jgi:CheY-like chemotaxis protein